MSTSLEELRAKLDELRTSDASIARWRSLQLQVLGAARDVQRSGISQDAPAAAPPFAKLWGLLAEPFWNEVDLGALAGMVEAVLTELESIAAMQQPRHGESS